MQRYRQHGTSHELNVDSLGALVQEQQVSGTHHCSQVVARRQVVTGQGDWDVQSEKRTGHCVLEGPRAECDQLAC